MLTKWRERVPSNRHMLTILGDYYENGMQNDHVTTENMPYKPLYFSLGSKHLEPASTYSDLIGTMSVFNCLYLLHYFSDRAESCQY